MNYDLKERLRPYVETHNDSGSTAISMKCSEPGCPRSMELGVIYFKYETQKKLDEAVDARIQSHIDSYKDKLPICKKCRYRNTWHVIINYFISAYCETGLDPNFEIILLDIKRYIDNVDISVTPSNFENMLKNRFVDINGGHMKCWNLAVNECEILNGKNSLKYFKPAQWRDEPIANLIGGFFSKFR